MTTLCRLHWGCDTVTPAGWINSDIKQGPGIELSCDLLAGLPLDDESIDYISSQHALQELKIADQVPALRELRRVLKSRGVLRLGLADLDRAIAAYQSGRREYFLVDDWGTLSGNFITYLLWHSYNHTLFTYEFAAELLRKAGFRAVRQVAYRQTSSAHPEIVELDTRPEESFYVEAFK
jgi:ubiquinone/menaquinone biosynthesis C-methylase UbiE